MIYHLEKLIIQPEKPKSTLDIFIASTELAEKSNLGQLFVLVEINSRERGLAQKIKELIKLVQNDYYSSPIPNAEKSLETTCQNLNLNLPEIISKPKIWYKKINILVGVLKDDDLIFSQLGKFSGYLIRKNKSSQILDTQNQNEEENIFSQITNGKIKTEDTIILSNYTLFDFFSLEKIKKITNKLEPQKATEHIKSLAKEIEKMPDALSLIIKCEEQTEKERIPQDEQAKQYLQDLYGSQESIQQLENLKKRTGRTLTSSFWPTFKKWNKKLITNLKNKNKKYKLELKLPKQKKITKKILEKAEKSSLNAKEKNLSIPKIKIPKPKNINFKIVIVLAVVFVASLIYLNYYQKAKKQNEHYQSILQQVSTHIEEAEAALIYKDEEKANQLLNQSLETLEQVPQDKKHWQDEYNTHQEKITTLLNKINGVYEVTSEKILDLVNLQIKKFIQNPANDKIYTLSSDNKIYKLINNQLTLFLAEKNIKDTVFLEENKGIVFLTQGNQFYIKPNPNAQSEKLNITLLEDALVKDIQTYGERIYFLDNLHGIYKITQILTANPQMSVWYADDKELINQGQKILVDGNVWLKSSNNIITKLYRNKKTNFEVTQLKKNLGNDILIYTQEDWNILYILDKQNSRIVVTDKTGVTLRQYLNSELTQAKNFIINTEQNQALISTNDKLSKINLEIK